jgi:solute carrier family 25 folate transporter 32
MVNTDFIAGISAGAVTTLVMHPLDLLKVRLQVDDFRAAAAAANPSINSSSIASSSSSSPSLSLSLPATTTHGRIARIFSTFTSYRDVYRGLSINLVGNTVSWGLYFGLYNEIKSVLIPPRLGNSINSSDSSSVGVNPQHLYLVSALFAGVTTSFLTNPLWVLKTRLLGTPRVAAAAAGSASGSGADAAGQSGRVVQGLAHILRTEGVRALWRGFVPGLFGVVQGSLQFTIYEDFKHRRLAHYPNNPPAASGSNSSVNAQLPTLEYLTISAVSKLLATVMLYPYQLVRSRMQVQNSALPNAATGATVPLRAMAILHMTVRTEGGISALYKGLGANLLRVVPSTCITFLVYEKVHHFLRTPPAA